jgi:class 3 adenylate cyclase
MITRDVVVDHVLFVVENLAASRELYTAALRPLGYRELTVDDDGVHYGADGIDGFAISQGSPVTSGAHVAFAAPDRESVDAFFTAALSRGATPRGTPGRWVQYSDRYYAAYANDLHGNNIEAVWHAPVPVDDAVCRVLATVLSTDIVASTEHLARVGDREWSAILRRHYAIIRQELERAGGREIDTAGDGMLAYFDQPGSAIRCAVAVVEAVREMGIEVRAGIHTGECEQIGDKLAGIAVHIAARVASRARANEVLVSQTVKELVAGSDLSLADAGGDLELKGVPGTWRLYAASLER